MTYFHVTLPSSWEKIKVEGLLPQLGERSQMVGEAFPSVFLFISEQAMEDALSSWLGAVFEDEEDLVALEVTPPKGMFLDEGVSCEYEVRSYETIPPDCIRFHSYV